MKSEILKYVRELDRVSFAELSKSIDGFKGDRDLPLESHPSILLWAGLSDAAINAIKDRGQF